MNNSIQPAALSRLLLVFAEGSRNDRLSLARLERESRSYYSDALEASGRLLSGGAETFRAQASLATLARLIWSFVPSRLLDSPSPDVRAMAERALVDRLGDFDGLDVAVRHLTIVFKRIRQYARGGRQSSSLNLESLAHRDLYNRQCGRCNHCCYEFDSDHYIYAAEDEGVVTTKYTPQADELTLDRTFRRPELDHIVPLILGGDSPDNWQILCRSCNVGKSDQISYMFSLSGQSYNRIGHLFELTAGKRYAVIAESMVRASPVVVPGDGKFYRIFKRNAGGLANPENLVAEYR